MVYFLKTQDEERRAMTTTSDENRKDWISFVKEVKARDKINFKEAMVAAKGEWITYLKEHAEKNPSYNHKESLQRKREEKKEKIANGEIEQPVTKSVKKGKKKERAEGEVVGEKIVDNVAADTLKRKRGKESNPEFEPSPPKKPKRIRKSAKAKAMELEDAKFAQRRVNQNAFVAENDYLKDMIAKNKGNSEKWDREMKLLWEGPADGEEDNNNDAEESRKKFIETAMKNDQKEKDRCANEEKEKEKENLNYSKDNEDKCGDEDDCEDRGDPSCNKENISPNSRYLACYTGGSACYGGTGPVKYGGGYNLK